MRILFDKMNIQLEAKKLVLSSFFLIFFGDG